MPKTAVPPHQSGTSADDNSAGPLPRQYNCADGASSKYGIHPRRKYNLLASEALEGGQANAGPIAKGDGHGDTQETAEAGRTETSIEAETEQRTLQERDRQEDGGEQQSPPDRSRALNTCSHPGG